MSSNPQPVHIAFIPLMAQGHLIPMVDMARVFASRGAITTIYTTPLNANRVRTTVEMSSGLGMPVRLVEVPFQGEEVGLPPEHENLDVLPRKLLPNFYVAIGKMQGPIEKQLLEQDPPTSCIVSDKYIFWSLETAQRFGIPRFVFFPMNCFSLLSTHNIKNSDVLNSVASDTEPFEVPEMPTGFKIAKAQLPGEFVSQPDFDDFRAKINAAEAGSPGVVVNSFDELEHGCVQVYEKATGKRLWCIGPVSLCSKDEFDGFERGNKVSSDAEKCTVWLDSMKPRSVIYACLGSQCRLVPAQMIELGRGLEASKHPFIWVIKRGEKDSELEKWLLEERYEEKIKGRGIIVRGWAPQVAILSHRATGGFLSHCGWNSSMEAMSSGLPMITWPQFAEQFLNEALIVDILKTGVRVGVKVPMRWGDEEKVGVRVKGEDIVRAINALMAVDDEGEERRKKAIEIGEKARQAMSEGGPCHSNVSQVFEYLTKESTY